MARPPRPISGLIKLAVILGIIYGATAVLVGPYLANKIGAGLSAHYSHAISIQDVRFSIVGPRLTLDHVAVKNPPEFSVQPAMEIQHVVINFDGFGTDPLHIAGVTFDGVVSNIKFDKGFDNLILVHRALSKRNKMMPHGVWATPTIVESIQIRNASLKSDLTTIAVSDVNADPVGTKAAPMMLENAVLNVLSATIQQQRAAIPGLLFKGATETVTDKINSVVRAVQEATE